MVLDTGNVSGVTGIVPGPPGPPVMVPGVHREGPPAARGSMGQKREGNQPKVGWCASHKEAQGAGGGEGEETLGAGGPKAHLGVRHPLPLPWPPHLPSGGAAAPPRVGTLGVAHPPPLLLYIVGVLGLFHT